MKSLQNNPIQKSKEKYIISCIPECRNAIDDYIKWRESLAESPEA
jgi:hypothetical protein